MNIHGFEVIESNILPPHMLAMNDGKGATFINTQTGNSTRVALPTLLDMMQRPLDATGAREG